MKSPLHSRSPQALSVCGKILKAGSSMTVNESAIGEREEKLAAKGQLSIRKSNKKGKVQIVCLLKG
jgi:hypothetical protein